MSVVLVVLLMCVRMTFILTDQTRAEAVMEESAVRAAGGKQDGIAFARRSRGYFYLPASGMRVKVSSKNVHVSLRAGIPRARFGEKFDADVRVRVRHPQIWVRGVRAAADAAAVWSKK